jgi:hypothetical protein
MIETAKFNIIKYLIIYLLLTFLFLIFLYPYEVFVLSKIQNITNTYKLPFNYKKIDSSPFKTTLEYVKLKTITFNKVYISYSPLSILTKNIYINLSNKNVTFNGTYKKDNLVYDVSFNLKDTQFQDLLLDGVIHINGLLDVQKKKGNFNISSNKLKVQVFKDTFNIGQLKGTANLSNNLININNIESTGNLKIAITGKIFLNNSNLELSSMNIKCGFSYNNNIKNLYIRGTINKPTFYTR